VGLGDGEDVALAGRAGAGLLWLVVCTCFVYGVGVRGVVGWIMGGDTG
jgi:hypothetical protein